MGGVYHSTGERVKKKQPLGEPTHIVSLSGAGRYADHLIHERSHIKYWAELVESGKVPDREYVEFPRGRVAA
jgi:hypothetical protein